MQPMTVEQALKLLDEATGQIRTDRATHIAMASAIEVLRQATAPVELKKDS